MAQGNDAAQAAQELATREGLEPNAESIIRESLRRYPADLKAASLLAENDEATEALDADKVAAAVNGEVLSFTVRGTEDPQVVIAYDAHDGVGVVKTCVPLAEVSGGHKAPAKKPAAKKAAPRRRAK